MADVTREIAIPRPPSVVWRQFGTEEALRRWLAPTLTIDLEEGGEYRMLGADGATWISGVVLELVPECRLVLSWLEEDAGWAHPGRLVIELRATDDGTAVSLTHDGFAGIGTATWRRTRDAYARGLAEHQVLEQLADAVSIVA
ncbi:SRPBCC family protein [Kribbella sp.]|uniref:SRPBCC family protein n=1 Tax=Kribbella sp. TaxID=1871183 RepID=UPI002D77F21C|nr:SRPBCC family protein [Kribbella sp.]